MVNASLVKKTRTQTPVRIFQLFFSLKCKGLEASTKAFPLFVFECPENASRLTGGKKHHSGVKTQG